MDWVEVQARTVEAAVEVAVQELGLATADDAEVEVLQEPQRGFLGMGGQDAIVRVRKGQPRRKARRGGRGRRGGREGGGNGGRRRETSGARQGGGERKASQPQPKSKPKAEAKGKGKGGGGKGGGRSRGSAAGGGADKPQRRREGSSPQAAAAGGGKGVGSGKNAGGRGGDEQRPPRARNETGDAGAAPAKEEPAVDINEQAQVVEEFIKGLIDAYGLEGTVETQVDDDIIKVAVTGKQTEALVGPKGAIMQAIHELLRIVVQRKTHHRARIRLDIAGYGERRREALVIYSQRLSEQILDQGGEVMLEPMNPADRKVVHDAIAEIEGVRSWSEGEEPNRSVILGLSPGTEPRGSSAAAEAAAPDNGDDAVEDVNGDDATVEDDEDDVTGDDDSTDEES